MVKFIFLFYKIRIMTLCLEAFGLILFKDKFDKVVNIAECYKRSSFEPEIQSRDAIKDIMDLGFVYWKSLLGIGVMMQILNINDFNHKEE